MSDLYRLTEYGEGVLDQMDGLIEVANPDYEAATQEAWRSFYDSDLMEMTEDEHADLLAILIPIVDAALGIDSEET